MNMISTFYNMILNILLNLLWSLPPFPSFLSSLSLLSHFFSSFHCPPSHSPLFFIHSLSSCSLTFLCSFPQSVFPAGSSLPALPRLCLAAVVPVSLSLPADRGLPVGPARQHPPATLLQLPGQLPAREMQTLPGNGHLRGDLASYESAGKGPIKALLCIDLEW